MANCNDIVYRSLLAKVSETEDLLEDCQQLRDVSGWARLQRKITSELKFLRKLSVCPEKLKKEHLSSSNLSHLSSIVKCCCEMHGVVKILEPFSYQEKIELPNAVHTADKRVVVDIVSSHGQKWVKVVARNPLALLQSSLGDGKFGRRSIIEQVEDMKACANQNPHLYTCPKIVVWFASGVTHNLRKHLEEMGVMVLGTTVGSDNAVELLQDDDNTKPQGNSGRSAHISDLCSISTSSTEHENSQLSEVRLNLSSQNDEKDHLNETYEKAGLGDLSNANVDINLDSVPTDAVLNLDISTMIAQVSNLTNGFCNFQFQEQALSDQARREKLFPVRKVLDLLLTGHKLVCCQTAYDDFVEILSTVGGEQEKARAEKMLSDVLVVPDNSSGKAQDLQISSKVRNRSKVIFGTGDNLKAITVTANVGFLRAAQSQGIKFVALVHESRALTEQKGSTAQSLDS